MIIVRLNGGLGNQLFQYAAGKALADFHNVQLKLDISLLNKNSKRNYELSNFAITAKIAGHEDLGMFDSKSYPLIGRFLNSFIYTFKPYYKRNIYCEPHFHFDRNFFKASKNVLLCGYWQSEQYFKNIIPTILKEFQLVPSQKGQDARILDIIRSKNSVSLHVRRGDYMNNQETHNFHGVCDISYYNKSIAYYEDKISSLQFIVFSDDIEWSRMNLNFKRPVVFVDHNSADKAYEDLRLMSQCKHHIIANSSFSWWGAWLGQNPDKIVTAPSKWFSSKENNTKDLIPETWHVL